MVNDVSECNTEQIAVYPASCSDGSTESYRPIDNFKFDQPVSGPEKQTCQVKLK